MAPHRSTHFGRIKQAESSRPAAVLIDRHPYSGTIYSARAIDQLSQSFHLIDSDLDVSGFMKNLERYREAELILGTWGLPPFSEEQLEQLPQLRAIFHAAGECRHLYTPACRKRGIIFCTSVEINSSYVAHHVYASIVMALKGASPLRDTLRQTREWEEMAPPRGIYGAKVGLVGLGRIGRLASQHLQALPVTLLAHDSFLPLSEVVSTGCVPASLEEVFATCDVISLHLPGGENTEGLVGRDQILSMKYGSVLLNTSRGSVVRQAELVHALRQRPDLTAYLDVCFPEPPDPRDPLYSLNNCYLTPHISGAIGSERQHLGDAMVEEAMRWNEGKPLQHGISDEQKEPSAPRLQVGAL